jgi:hypothetical protein
MEKSTALAEAIRQHEAQATDLKSRYSKAIDTMVGSPRDAQLHAQMAGEMAGEMAALSNELAGVAAGLQALRQAHDEVIAQETESAAAASRAEAKKRIGGFVKKFHQRNESYTQLQHAAAAFIEALREHVESGRSLRPAAAAIATGLWGSRAEEHIVTVLDAAAGVTNLDAAAVATVLREAIQVFGPHRLGTYIAINDFVKPVSFIEAHAANAEVVAKLEKA